MIFEVFDIDSEYYKEMMNIIIMSKLNPPKYGQIHHIIPRCWFKHYNLTIDNSTSNTVILTYKNHKKVHTLAYKCAKEQWMIQKLACAAHLMGDNEAKYTPGEETRKKISESLKGRNVWNKGIQWSNPNGSIALKGRKLIFTDEHCKHISEAKRGKKPKISAEGMERRRQATIKYNKTRIYKPSEETKNKISLALKGKKKSRKNKV